MADTGQIGPLEAYIHRLSKVLVCAGQVARSQEQLDELAAGLETAAADASRDDVAVARAGTLLTVFFRPSVPLDAADAFTSDRAAYARFFGAMLDRGVLLPPSQFEAWFPSMSHGPVEIDATIAAARIAFKESA